jgi:hypothetical protein
MTSFIYIDASPLMKICKHIIILLLIFFTQLCQADFQSAGEAYKKGDYETAFNELLPLAETGDHRAMYAVGSMYAAGNGVEQDLAEAMKWFKEAAKYGRPDAHYKIGLMYEQGLGVEQNYRKALHWYGIAAKHGYGYAQYKIGLFYSTGQGVKQDLVKSYAWLVTSLGNGVKNANQLIIDIKQQLMPEELAEARALAGEFQKY